MPVNITVELVQQLMEQNASLLKQNEELTATVRELNQTIKELKEQLIKALGALTEKEKKVVVLYYYEDLTLKEISRVLEVSESRVSQLHTKAIMKMRGQLGDYQDMLFQI